MSRLTVSELVTPGVSATRLEVDNGRCATLSGPSGSGKSLLLRAIADLDPSSGEVWLDDIERASIDPAAWRRQVSYVAADSAWWQDTVGAHASHWPGDVLAALGFEDDVLEWEIQRLSMGERQRLAVARSLAMAPRALLLDEPTANLDAENTQRMEGLIRDWRMQTGGCVLWVSHDPEQRRRIGQRHFVMRDGRLGADSDE
jgi:ABC-type iron transport system FetAB ATPase subunit